MTSGNLRNYYRDEVNDEQMKIILLVLRQITTK